MVDAGSMLLPDVCEFHTKHARLCEKGQTHFANNWEKFAQDGGDRAVHNSAMPTTVASDILSKWLDEAREKAGLNQSELARGVGLTSQKVNRIISGVREMTAEELIRFSAFLNAPIPDLPDAKLPRKTPSGEDLAPPPPDESGFTRDYDRAFAAALHIEREEFDGEMPLDEFITAVTIGLRSQKRAR